MSIEANGRMSDSPPSVEVYLTEDAVIVSGHRPAVDVATTTFAVHPDSAVD